MALHAEKGTAIKHSEVTTRLPNGIFHISDIRRCLQLEAWFRWGEGEIAGAYGPWFLRLEVPGHKGIGIHGTHKPESISTRDTEGCIRLRKWGFTGIETACFIGMTVIVLPSLTDLAGTAKLDSLQKKAASADTILTQRKSQIWDRTYCQRKKNIESRQSKNWNGNKIWTTINDNNIMKQTCPEM